MLKVIQEILKGTFLETANMIELAIPRTTDTAIAIAVTSENKLEAWKLLKSYLDQTRMYPVITYCWCYNPSLAWDKSIIAVDLFCRFYFDEEYPEKRSPEEIIAKVDLYSANDLELFLAAQANRYNYHSEEELIAELENTRANLGIAPLISAIKESAEVLTTLAIERYLFNWEQSQNLEPKLYLDYQDWFEPIDQYLALVLLPNPHSWNALAYLSWYGGSKNAIPLIKKWHRDHGAELVCHYGTMLQFFVEHPPANSKFAFNSAWEQVALAECTTVLPRVSIRDHARALLKLDRWFLHERP